MAVFHVRNKKTKKVIKIEEKMFPNFGIQLEKENGDWEIFTPKLTESQAKANKLALKNTRTMKNEDGKIIRVDDSQVDIFKSNGFELCEVEDEIPSQKEVENKTEKAEKPSEAEVIEFLSNLDKEDDSIWGEDGVVSKEFFDEHFKGLISSEDEDVKVLMDTFSRENL